MGNSDTQGHWTLVSRNPWKLPRAKISKGARRTHTRALIARFHLRFLWFSSGFLFVFLGLITAGKWQESPRSEAPLGFRKIAGKESRAPSVSAAAYKLQRSQILLSNSYSAISLCVIQASSTAAIFAYCYGRRYIAASNPANAAALAGIALSAHGAKPAKNPR